MPIYEYRCESCDHELEALQKISDDPLRTCPACKNATLKKKVSAAAFRLKGAGWYETDFKSGKQKNLASSSSDDSASASSEKTSSSDKGTSDKGASNSSSSTKEATAGKTSSNSNPGKSV